MKKLITTIAVLSLMILSSCKEDSNYEILSKTEKEIFNSMNEARKDPKAYAEKYLKTGYNPNAQPDNGAGPYAQKTAYEYMMSLSPMSPLKLETGLVMAARDHVQDPQRDNAHHSTRGGDLTNGMTIAKLYAKVGGGGGEIAWPSLGAPMCGTSGGEWTKGWIIDSGAHNEGSWGHRLQILNPNNTKVGISYSKGYGFQEGKYSLVGVLSGNYESKSEVEDDHNWKPSQITWDSDHKPLECTN